MNDLSPDSDIALYDVVIYNTYHSTCCCKCDYERKLLAQPSSNVINAARRIHYPRKNFTPNSGNELG